MSGRPTPPRRASCLLVAATITLGVPLLVPTPAEAASAARSTPPSWGTSAPAPAGTTAQLFGVTARAGQAWAVGGANPTGRAPTQVLTDPVAQRFDGTQWLATPVPPVTTYGTSRAVALRGVSAASSTDVWAVGAVEDLGSLSSQTLAYRWDGSAWTRRPTPNPAGPASANHLTAVAAQSGQAVYAVGDQGFPARSLVLRYDGATWTQLPVPDYGALTSVTADAAGVWVAGRGVVARFDGATWTRLPAVPAGLGFVRLTGIAGGAGTLWLVGDDQTTYFEGTVHGSYAARFSGGRWTKLPGTGASYTGVASAGETAWASSPQDAVTRFSGTTAALEVTPAPGRLLSAVAADPGGRQWAVGAGTGTGTTTGRPAIITSPAIGQGGLSIVTGASQAAVTWLGPVTGSSTADGGGVLSVGGLPAGSYTVVVSVTGCIPVVVTATVTAPLVTRVDAAVTCP